MYYVLYRLICNLVPFATDMTYGRHLGFQNYPILVFWQSNPLNMHPNLARTQQTFAKDVLYLCLQHVRIWETNSLKTDASLDLSTLQPEDVSSETLEKIERFILIMYSRKCSASGLNEARKELFAQCSRTMENIPPTKAALLQHVQCAAYQAGYHMCGHI